MKIIFLPLFLIIWKPCLTWTFGLNVADNEETASNSRFIFGGEVTQPHSKPYQVYLIMYKLNSKAICGGSLISPNYILTAAHCVRG
jgi:secreted trypsin-like serine protease